MSACVFGFDNTGVGGWCVTHQRWLCNGGKTMTSYERKIMDAFEAVNKANGGKGASADEVTQEMQKRGTLSELDTVIDIADLMGEMSKRGYF